jgi:pilus assembly protein Flp/PilA
MQRWRAVQFSWHIPGLAGAINARIFQPEREYCGTRRFRKRDIATAARIEHCTSCLEVPLTVQVGKFFKSWVQGSYCRRLEHPSCRCQEDVVLKLLFSGFWADRSAATAIEYGLVMAGIALAILAALNGVGTSISRILTTVSSSLR